MALTSTGYQVNKQPIAQSFYISEPRGIYCTKVDLFFAAKDSSLPVQIQLRPMIEGFPSSSQIIPGTQVVKAAGDVVVDTTGPDLTPTSFTFAEPVFLKGKQDYALVVIADSIEYQVYVAEIQEFAFGSTEKRANKNPVSGSLFFSQNGVTFTPAQNQDLAFVVHQAKFKHTSAEAIFHNASVPKQKLGNNPLTVTASSSTVKVFHLNHGLEVGNKVTLSGATTTGGIAAATLNKTHTVVAKDFTGYTFTADSAADSDAISGGSSILADKNIPFSLIFPNAQNLQPKDTYIEAAIKATTAKSYAGSETAFQKQSTFKGVQINENNADDKMYLVANDSAENAELGAGNKSLDMAITLKTDDSNVSPMIDLQRLSATLVSNLIDKQSSSAVTGFNVPLNFVDETFRGIGSSAAKHVTNVMRLANDSVGLKVLLSANVPAPADFQLFFRTCTADEVITDVNFTQATPENVLPKDNNPNVFRQYEFLIGGQNGSLPAFTSYQIKIVMRSTNQALVPKFRDLRVIALSV